ncbi:FGGY-family carbohydrate kinase [Frigidibacter mobilis]|uniref:Sugar kinase n=1 Tax=Frigidibacter mobilis TaxID=1335048 RepID=A0A159ZAS3_9RHOB|nr:FGGY family carbohydrate kinase [Frigidibacter mobilis]AMY72000.1 sugar kinase [Frigidibacter mobilis]
MRDLTIGLDCGTGGARALVTDAAGRVLAMAVRDYPTAHPHPGWATQSPADWWGAACGAVRAALAQGGIAPGRVAAICATGTSSTMVALDTGLQPLGDAILWMDCRASPQARRIEATGHPALRRSRAGVSAETALPKILWVKDTAPALYDRSRWFVEMADYLALRLSGELTLGQNQTINRWFYDPRTGWPEDFLAAMGLGGITARFPARMPAVGEVIGPLQPEAAAALGLDPETRVVAGGTDAYVAMVGLNTLRPGETALITGTSHLVLPVVAEDAEVEGLFGPHPDCVTKGVFVMEGGQVSSGALLRWWHDLLHQGQDCYDVLLAAAQTVPPGACGLVVLDFWQGNRNPFTDYDLQGAIWGLTLKHGQAEITRALMESVALGTANILDRLTGKGMAVSSMTLAGGVLRSRFWAQMHADATNTVLRIPEVSEATAFGAAIAAAVGAGLHPSLETAADAMVRIRDEIHPDPASHAQFRAQLDVYLQTHAALKPLMHRMAALTQAAAASAA